MTYTLKRYDTLAEFENRKPSFVDEGYKSLEGALEDAKCYLKGSFGAEEIFGTFEKSKKVKVESADQEEIIILTGIEKDRVKLAIDQESVNIYVDNGDMHEPTHIVYWNLEEVAEDENVAISIANAVDLYHRDIQQLVDILGYYYLVVQ